MVSTGDSKSLSESSILSGAASFLSMPLYYNFNSIIIKLKSTNYNFKYCNYNMVLHIDEVIDQAKTQHENDKNKLVVLVHDPESRIYYIVMTT